MNMRVSTCAVLLAVFMVLAGSCQKGSRALPAKPSPDILGLKGGELVFEEDFSGDLEHWSTKSPNWRIEQGALYTGDRASNNEGIWLKDAALPTNFRVEFDARSVKGNNTDFQGDIKCEFGGDTPQHSSGYIVIFGGWLNSKNLIARQDEHNDGPLVVDTDRQVEEGRTYRFAIVRYGQEIRWFLDGALFLKTLDSNVLTGGVFGFNNWNSRVFFDNVQVYRL